MTSLSSPQGSGQFVVHTVRVAVEASRSGGSDRDLYDPPAQCAAVRDVRHAVLRVARLLYLSGYCPGTGAISSRYGSPLSELS